MSEIKTIIIGDIEYDLVPRNKEPEQKPKKGRWKPNIRQQYLSLYGAYIWTDNVYDNKCYSLWLVFQTETERDEYIARQQAIVRVNDRIDELNDGWEPDWSDNDMQKYQIYFNCSNNKFSIYYFESIKYTSLLKNIKSESIAYQVISEMNNNLDLIFKK